jgi:hypothetical protein
VLASLPVAFPDVEAAVLAALADTFPADAGAWHQVSEILPPAACRFPLTGFNSKSNLVSDSTKPVNNFPLNFNNADFPYTAPRIPLYPHSPVGGTGRISPLRPRVCVGAPQRARWAMAAAAAGREAEAEAEAEAVGVYDAGVAAAPSAQLFDLYTAFLTHRHHAAVSALGPIELFPFFKLPNPHRTPIEL